MTFISVVINIIALKVGGASTLIIVSLIAAIWAMFINSIRRFDPEPLPLYVMVFCLGSLSVGIYTLIEA